MLFFFLFAIGLLVAWIAALADILKSDFKEKDQKLIWIIVVILLPLIGTILYFTLGSKQKQDTY